MFPRIRTIVVETVASMKGGGTLTKRGSERLRNPALQWALVGGDIPP